MSSSTQPESPAPVSPGISVIIPAYNAGLFIADCLQSVIEQTYADWEAIVVDDGSSDDTAAVVRGLVERDNRIKYFFQANGRQGKARNTAVAHAEGSLLAFLDADDLWEPNKLALQKQAIEDNGADIVYSDGVIFDAAQTNGDANFPVRPGRTTGAAMIDQLLMRNRVPLASVLMRRTTFDAAGGFEEELEYQACEDYDLWLKAAETGAVFFGMPEKLVRYRRHAGATTYRESNVLRPMLRVVARHINKGTLTEAEKETRIRELSRRIVAALLNEGRPAEAKIYFEELAARDNGIVTAIQKVLMKLSPASFNFISRECLYRTEWHWRRLTGRSSDLANC